MLGRSGSWIMVGDCGSSESPETRRRDDGGCGECPGASIGGGGGPFVSDRDGPSPCADSKLPWRLSVGLTAAAGLMEDLREGGARAVSDGELGDEEGLLLARMRCVVSMPTRNA